MLFLLLATAGVTAQAVTPCSLAATGPATITREVERLPVPSVQENCEGLRITGGPVIACVQDQRQRLTCRKLVGDTTLEAHHLATPGPGRKWLDSLMALLRGSDDETSAHSRRPVVRGLPEGDVAFVGQMPDASLLRGALESVSRIEFRDTSTRQVVWILDRTSVASDSRTKFKHGKQYSWTIRSTSPPLDEATGKFRVAETVAVLGDIEEIAGGADLTDPAVALAVASYLSRKGLEFDARNVLTQAGFHVH